MLFAHFMFRGAFVCSTVSDQLKIPYHLRVHTNYSNLLYSAQLRLIQNADSISTISRHTADYLETEFGLKNVPVIRQSLLIQNAPVEESQARQSETIRLIAAGRFVQKKGFHQLIHAVSLLELSSNQRIELNIYGEGPMLNRYLSDIKQLGLAEQCYVHPRISHSSLMKKIALSDLMVVPSIESKDDIDGIPTVIPEAMILGVPVIATDVGGISELIEDMNTGFLLKSQELSALASRISTAIEKREDWGRIVHNAKLKVLKEYELNLSDKLEPALISKHKKD
jgi:colanic acid/amylovoran biosynthesis glycosyltransferase